MITLLRHHAHILERLRRISSKILRLDHLKQERFDGMLIPLSSSIRSSLHSSINVKRIFSEMRPRCTQHDNR